MVQDMQALEKVQRRATKLVQSIQHLPCEERLCSSKLLSLKNRVLCGDLIETYKILTGRSIWNQLNSFNDTEMEEPETQNRTRTWLQTQGTEGKALDKSKVFFMQNCHLLEHAARRSCVCDYS